MSPEQQKIQELEKQVQTLISFMNSFNNPAQIAPQHLRTLRTLIGATRLSDLEDVSGTDSATTGQVLKKTATTWQPGTDNI